MSTISATSRILKRRNSQTKKWRTIWGRWRSRISCWTFYVQKSKELQISSLNKLSTEIPCKYWCLRKLENYFEKVQSRKIIFSCEKACLFAIKVKFSNENEFNSTNMIFKFLLLNFAYADWRKNFKEFRESVLRRADVQRLVRLWTMSFFQHFLLMRKIRLISVSHLKEKRATKWWILL